MRAINEVCVKQHSFATPNVAKMFAKPTNVTVMLISMVQIMLTARLLQH